LVLIEIRDLSKSFGQVRALDRVNLSIRKGEFYSLLGPNGAGKSTLVNILGSVLKADGGKVGINGYDLESEPQRCKSSIGVVPQEIALYNDLSAYDNLLFWGGLYRLGKNKLRQRARELLSLTGLEERGHERVVTYSGGMKRRINIACALLHEPEIIFMDEPTPGIDPQSRNLIHEFILKLHREGKTILYTTHYMEEAEKLSERIGIIDHGRIIAEGNLEDLRKNQEARETIVVKVSDASLLPKELLARATRFPFEVEGDRVMFRTASADHDLPQIISLCRQLDLDIINIEMHRINLETLFLNLTGRRLRD
jgi:ABC-2 type transport system ATP-binding protein